MTDMTDHEIDAAMAIRADEDAEITSLRAEREAAQQEPRRDPPTALRSSMSDAVRRLGFWVPGFHDY